MAVPAMPFRGFAFGHPRAKLRAPLRLPENTFTVFMKSCTKSGTKGSPETTVNRQSTRNKHLCSSVVPFCAIDSSRGRAQLRDSSDFEAFPDLVDCRIDEELEKERGEDARDHRRGDAAH